MSSIKIVSIPPGFAPVHVREQWVGITIPLATEDDLKRRPLTGFKIGNENDGGYLVLLEKAIEALISAGRSDAADFWERGSELAIYLQFKKEVCELIE